MKRSKQNHGTPTSKTQIEPAIKQNEQQEQNRVRWIMYRTASSLSHLLTSRRQVSRRGTDATHTGRMMVAVPKCAIIARARCSKLALDSQTSTTATLCLFNKGLPKACLLPATDATDATDWKSGKSMLGTRTTSQDAGTNRAYLKNMAESRCRTRKTRLSLRSSRRIDVLDGLISDVILL